MKNFKFLYLLLAVVGVVTFTSCTEEWAPGAQDTNAGVYFPDTSVINVTAEATSADIVVKRTNAAEALTLTVRSVVAEDATDFLSVPSSVTFDAGSDTAILTVAINDAANMVLGKKYVASIKLSEQASTYGTSEYDFVFMIPEKWVDYTDEAGKLIYGTYVDDFFCPLLDYDAGYAVPIQIQKHEIDANRFRVVEPFGKQFCKYMFGNVPGYFKVSEAYLEFDITDHNNVTVVGNPVNIGVSINFSDIGLAPMYLYVASDENGQVPGAVTYNDGVIQFAAGAVSILYEYEGKLYQLTPTNASGLMAYALPGVEITDYALSVEYTGMFVAADNSEASAVLEFGAGADVESIKYAVVEGDVTKDYASVVEGIVDGSVEPIYVIEEEAQLTQEIALSRGTWTVVAVPYGAEEAEVEDAIAYSFWFNGIGEVPQVEIEVRFGSMLELTGEEDAEHPSDYWAGIGIVANGDDIKSIKAFVETLASVESFIDQKGVSYEDILAVYGEDYSSDIEELKANGSAIVGPFNVPLDTEVIALVSIETIYGETKFFSKTCKTTNSTGIEFGQYSLTEGDYSSVVGIFGGYKAGEVYFVIDGMFEMVGSYDTTTRTMTTPGVEETYAKGDLICNDVYFYYNEEKTQAYGYWAASDASFETPCDLTFAYGEDGVVNALACYFAKNVFNLADSTFAFSEYSFTPAATVTKYVAEATPSKAAFACAKSSTSNAKLANVTVKSGDRIWIPAK